MIMRKTEILTTVSRTFHRAAFQIKKHSPEILVAAGVIGTVASGVLACKATLKVNEVVGNAKDDINKIHEATKRGYTNAGEEYIEEDAKKDLALVYAQTGVKLVKLYGPAVVLGAASIGCMLTSHNIMRKRNVALAAAYTTLDKGFKAYRGRVIERFGEDMDRELKYNIKAKEIEERVVDENGNEKIVAKSINVIDPNHYSPYSIVFDDGNIGWDKDPELTKYFLIQQQNYANELLKSKGHLFLNEVYDMLGAQRTKAGQCVGWVYDEKNATGDNFVDFGIFDIYNPKARDFVNGYEKVIVLDFNVDGDILNYI